MVRSERSVLEARTPPRFPCGARGRGFKQYTIGWLAATPVYYRLQEKQNRGGYLPASSYLKAKELQQFMYGLLS